MERTVFYQITDLHCLAPSEAKTPERRREAEERAALIDAAVEMIGNDDEAGFVIVSGDLSDNGSRREHEICIEKLSKLNERKPVLVITATHDYCYSEPTDTVIPDSDMPRTGRWELRQLYDKFGFSSARAEYERMSYTADVGNGLAVLMLNDDGNGRSFCGYGEGQLEWIRGQVQELTAEGKTVIAVTHHPVIPPTPVYPLISKRDMLGDYENTSRFLADLGIEFVLTGHTHMQSIRSITTEKGNTLYDINTGTLTSFPTAIRRMVLDGNALDVKTLVPENAKLDTGGKGIYTYFADKFDSTLYSAVDAMRRDTDALASILNAVSIGKDTVMRLRVPFKILGTVLDTITLGGVGRLTFISGSVDKSIKKTKLKDFAASVFRNIWGGDEPYSPETPEGKAAAALARRVSFAVKKKESSLPGGSLEKFVSAVIYDPTPDSNAVLKRKNLL